jgi:transcriptional regulator with XRE-family HTH domain
MATNTIFKALVESLEREHGKLTQKQIANALNVTQATVGGWMNGGTPSARNFVKLIDAFRDHHAISLIRPLLEFKEIAPIKKGKTWAFSADAPEIAAIQDAMEKKAGLYFFYDSSGQAIYAGKSDFNLYGEARQRLKAIPNQPMFLPIKKYVGQMGDRARYLSAYEVTITAAIKNMESFLLRAFANDLLNKNGGAFYSSL